MRSRCRVYLVAWYRRVKRTRAFAVIACHSIDDDINEVGRRDVLVAVIPHVRYVADQASFVSE